MTAHLRPIIRRNGGFTLVEVLATLMLVAIVLPAIMQGISLSTAAASAAKRRTEAAGLAEGKMSELLATLEWDGGTLSGDFSPDWPDYSWQATVQPWALDTSGANIQQIDVQVTWTERNRQNSVTVSSLTYDKTQTLSTNTNTTTQ